MIKSDIYVGAVKRCINIEKYKMHGEKYNKPEYRINSMVVGTIIPTVDIINKEEVLIKTSKGYIRLIDIYGLFTDARLEKGKINSILLIKPVENGDLFVDEKSLQPYYTEALEEKIRVKKLRDEVLYDCRIKKGIEH